MTNYPADEHRLQEVERGRVCEAVVLIPPGEALAAGDSLVFALARTTRPGREPDYVKGGDSVRVLLTAVTVLGEADPVTGGVLARLAWAPLGGTAAPAVSRAFVP